MASLKALIVMTIWTVIVVGGMYLLDFGSHHREPLWAIGGAILLLVVLIVNVWIYFAIAKEEPWKWIK
jgi:hypothetical protein